MINFNGTITEDANILAGNRAFLYGDSVFETVKILDGKVLFLEDHYFRLMSAMRIVRMEIPMNFTMEYFEEQILSTAASENFSGSCRARISVYRKEGGFYLPKDNNVSFLITVLPLEDSVYRIEKDQYEVELYKDFIVTKHLLSTIKSSNRMINVTGSIFADENDYDNCLLINDEKNVIEALNGNLFMLMGNKLVTPPISEGCLNGVMRKQILALAKKIETIEVEETPISPFDLQKADELFITNVVRGIQPITKYRKKEYGMGLAKDLLLRLNAQIRLG
ncbi:aminotransferase class IV [Flavobacterium lindanitolerans]|uniref:branched-chain-amino-acid transaminase n=1 Tax=Flavobacterium lindanitolerans TaxID=428988 RepID=A0A497V9B9_9FLAO|nr:aminotransferase class IV [Flavobacterium lindanitolerans]PKW29650.1 branched-chain amino acid aminotransferase [Flavobacterium lindanitolerans]RLJ34849.1 branched-chain amino acid aminotransferase [Flavobacterium lindanitolerans]